MTDDRNREHAENMQLLGDLCEAIFPAGSYPVDFGPDKPPAIAYHFEGATGVALPLFYININEPVIRELARRAIEARAGGEPIQPATVHIKDKIEIDRDYGQPKRPIFIDALFWYNGLKDGFKKVGYSDATIADGLWQYINHDMTFFLSFFEAFYRQKRAHKLEHPKFEHPIVVIDSTTAREFFEVYKVKGLFGRKLDGLKSNEEILEIERARLKKDAAADLTYEEQRAALAREKYYRSQQYIYTDFGDFCIGFNINLYGEYLKSQNKELNKENENALANIASYKIAYELAHIVLAEVYEQKKLTNLYIPYEKILQYLQEPTSNKTIYRQIRDGFHALRFLDYTYWDYSNITAKKIERSKKDFSQINMTGNFIYNFGDDGKGYYLDVNEKFVGCALLVVGPEQPKKAKSFSRGYHRFPTVSLGITRRAGSAVAFLTNRLFAETGNDKLNTETHKVITPAEPAGETLCKWASIEHGRISRRWSELLKTLAKVDIIDKIEPSLSTLRKLKPSAGMKQKIRIHIKSDVTAIDAELKEKIGENK